MKFIRQILFFLGVIIVAGVLSAQSRHSLWNVYSGERETGSSPVLRIGDIDYVDALSLCDALQVYYARDDWNRYIFTLSGSSLIAAPDATFLQSGDIVIHLPRPPFRENYRFYVPETAFLQLLIPSLPGQVQLNDSLRTIHYTPPSSDVLSLTGSASADTAWFEMTLTRPFDVTMAAEDSNHLSLAFDGISIGSPPPLAGTTGLQASWEHQAGKLILQIPFPIGRARLQQPDDGGVLRLHIGPNDGGGTPLAYGDRLLMESLQQDREAWRIDRIMIDPGHGGKDPGAVGQRNTYEKTIALDIGIRLRDELRERTQGIDVLITRDDDTFIPLRERTSMANSANAKLFVSIHCNAEPRNRARGQVTFFLSPARNERAMQSALRENSVIRFEDSQEGYEDLTEENFILLSMAQANFIRESETLAATIQEDMSLKSGLRNRGVDQAGFYVLIGASMPAVLVETGFISTWEEETLFRTPAFRQKLAEGICDGILEFVAASAE